MGDWILTALPSRDESAAGGKKEEDRGGSIDDAASTGPGWLAHES